MRKVQDTDRFAQRRTAPQLYEGWQHCRGIGGSFRLEGVAGLLWNQWQLSCGTGGSFAVESVAGFAWNWWQLWRGIRIAKGGHSISKSIGLSDTNFL